MNTFVALIRGINVGGHNTLPMANLRAALSEAGFQNVKTYIQSGNVIFDSHLNDENLLEKTISEVLSSVFSLDVPVIVKSANAIKAILDHCPFAPEMKENSYFILLNKTPDKVLVNDVSSIAYEGEQFQIIRDCLYFYSSHGYGRTKFNMKTFEKRLRVTGTSRNYKTMLKLLALSRSE